MTINAIPLVGRVLLAAIFVLSGIGKIFAPEATLSYIASAGLPFPQLAFVGAVAIEIGGGLLLAVGFGNSAPAARYRVGVPAAA